MKKIEKIRDEFKNNKAEYRYKVFTAHKDGETYFQIADIQPDRLFWGDFVCNFDLYQKSLDDCIKAVNGTKKPIIYNGKNINHIKESVFLTYNPFSGEIYRDYIY